MCQYEQENVNCWEGYMIQNTDAKMLLGISMAFWYFYGFDLPIKVHEILIIFWVNMLIFGNINIIHFELSQKWIKILKDLWTSFRNFLFLGSHYDRYLGAELVGWGAFQVIPHKTYP